MVKIPFYLISDGLKFYIEFSEIVPAIMMNIKFSIRFSSAAQFYAIEREKLKIANYFMNTFRIYKKQILSINIYEKKFFAVTVFVCIG